MTASETYKQANQDYQLAYGAYMTGAITVQELKVAKSAKQKAFREFEKSVKARFKA